MLTCSNCGATVREGARFCTSCGTRLNDPVASDARGVWAAPVASGPDRPATIEPESSSEEPASPEPATAWSGDTSAQDEPVSAPDPEPETEVRPEPAPAPEEGFTWSWGGSPANGSGAEPDAVDQVDEESGVVLEEAESTDSETDSGDLVDATEIDILETDEPASGANDEDEPEPETSDTVLVIEDDEDSHDEAETDTESETLAAWAEQWETPESEGDAAMHNEASADPERDETAAPEGAAKAVASDSGAERPGDNDEEEEDTVTKAERLIGELRAMIPSLMRPAPPVSGTGPDSSAVADELESAARSGQFDDLRETLRAAREHPRDVDTMLTLSGNVDRLLELLDDRDNLAQTAERAASRLRPGGDATEL